MITKSHVKIDLSKMIGGFFLRLSKWGILWLKFSVKETLFSTSDIGIAKKCSIEEIIKNKYAPIERLLKGWLPKTLHVNNSTKKVNVRSTL
jgi:hypothetical protein